MIGRHLSVSDKTDKKPMACTSAHPSVPVSRGGLYICPAINSSRFALEQLPMSPAEPDHKIAPNGQKRTFEKLRVYRYCFISTMIGLSMSLSRMTTVLEGLSVRLLPKCGVFGGV
jgi:hypothetical protein